MNNTLIPIATLHGGILALAAGLISAYTVYEVGTIRDLEFKIQSSAFQLKKNGAGITFGERDGIVGTDDPNKAARNRGWLGEVTSTPYSTAKVTERGITVLQNLSNLANYYPFALRFRSAGQNEETWSELPPKSLDNVDDIYRWASDAFSTLWILDYYSPQNKASFWEGIRAAGMSKNKSLKGFHLHDESSSPAQKEDLEIDYVANYQALARRYLEHIYSIREPVKRVLTDFQTLQSRRANLPGIFSRSIVLLLWTVAFGCGVLLPLCTTKPRRWLVVYMPMVSYMIAIATLWVKVLCL